MSKMLELAKVGAVVFLPADHVDDEIIAELEEWTELGYVLLDCGCVWLIEDLHMREEHMHPEARVQIEALPPRSPPPGWYWKEIGRGQTTDTLIRDEVRVRDPGGDTEKTYALAWETERQFREEWKADHGC